MGTVRIRVQMLVPVHDLLPTGHVAVGSFPSLLTGAPGSSGSMLRDPGTLSILPHPLACLILGMPLAMW